MLYIAKKNLLLGILVTVIVLVGCQPQQELADNIFKDLGDLSDEELDEVLQGDEAVAGQAYSRLPAASANKIREVRKKVNSFKWLDCTDTDKGINPALTGTVTVKYSYGGRSGSKQLADTCINKNSLQEYYCKVKDKTYAKTTQTCEFGCEDGACKEPLSVCGNGILDTGEICEVDNLKGATCAGLGKGTGTLKCFQDCKEFDLSGCITLKQAYDEDGRLTDYARSFAPKMLTLNLQELPKLYPEKHGNNYFVPGTYNIMEGDGFGKGDFLIKFTKFIPTEYYYKDNSKFQIEGTGIIYFEVFKKESNGNYYHFPTLENQISSQGILDLFGISFESSNDAVKGDKNTLIYHPNCKVFYDYCDQEGYWHALVPEMCNWRCPFEANTEEIKIQEDSFTAVYPNGYKDLADFSVGLLQKCYGNDIEFLGYDPNKPRIGIKYIFGQENEPFTGKDEYVFGKLTKFYFDQYKEYLDFHIDQMEDKKCANSYLPMGHELTHILTEEILGENYGLKEGLADFVGFQNDGENKYTCLNKEWRYNWENSNENKNYVDLSTNPGPNSDPWFYYYATGYCFWTNLVKEYGYPAFVEIMQKLYTKSRGIDDYYVLEVMEGVVGPLSKDIIDRYSLTKKSTALLHN